MSWIGILGIVAATAIAVVFAMNFATPEKKLERNLPHRFPVGEAQFRREMSVLLGPSIVPGNSIEVLENGSGIFPAMLEAIRAARRTITFETYIYWSGEVGREFSDALSERARAGVRVHLTIDWVGSIKMDESLLQQMEEAGVEIERYRPLKWYNLGRLNNRTHRKLLVIDGRVGFTGGVGIADNWQGDADSPEHWRDLHFRVEGPVVAQFQSAFNDNWIKTTGTVLSGPDYFPPLASTGSVPAHVFIASPAGGGESMHLMYLMSVAAAQHSIDLAAAYFVPDDLMRDQLLQARARGVRIRVLVPGRHIDSETVRRASKAMWGELLQAGIEIHEYQPTMMHSKLLVVDGELVSVGSTNFDSRSFRLNDEASLNAYDRDFAQRMTLIFERDLAHAQRYTYARWHQRPLGEKVAEVVVRPVVSQL